MFYLLILYHRDSCVAAQMVTAATPSTTSVWMMMNVLRQACVVQLIVRILLAPSSVAALVDTPSTLLSWSAFRLVNSSSLVYKLLSSLFFIILMFLICDEDHKLLKLSFISEMNRNDEIYLFSLVGV